MVDQIWCGAPWNLNPLRTLFKSSGNMFQYKCLSPRTLGLRPEKCLLLWRILRLWAIIASTHLCWIMKWCSFDNCLTFSEAFLILLFLPWSYVLRQSDSSSKPQNVIAKNKCWETGFNCFLGFLKKKNKCSTKYPGGKGRYISNIIIYLPFVWGGECENQSN